MITMYAHIDSEVEVEGVFHKGSKDLFDRGFGNWLPGDSSYFEVKHIWLFKLIKLPNGQLERRQIDIKDFLEQHELNKIEEDCYASIREDKR